MISRGFPVESPNSTHPLGPAGLAGEAEGRPSHPCGVGYIPPERWDQGVCPSRALDAPATALNMQTQLYFAGGALSREGYKGTECPLGIKYADPSLHLPQTTLLAPF